MTHGKILQADGPTNGITDDSDVGETASQGTRSGDSATATGGKQPGTPGTPRSWRRGPQAVRAAAVRLSRRGGSPSPSLSRQSSVDR